MSELKTFTEWRKGQPRRHHPKNVAVKNPYIDAFVKSVDNLKKDMDTLDATEKKEKPKKDNKSFDRFKDYKKKRDLEDKKEKDHEEADDSNPIDDISDEPDDNRPGEPVRRLPGYEVPVRPQILRKKSHRQDNSGAMPMGS